MTVAGRLLASLDGQTSSPSPSSFGPSQPEARSARPQTNKGPSTAPTRTGTERVGSMISGALSRQARQRQMLNAGRRPGQPSRTTVEELENAKRANDLSKQISRRWKAGDVYAPHDLSAEEMAKWKKREEPKYDVFDLLGYDPLENYKVRPRHLSLLQLQVWAAFEGLPCRLMRCNRISLSCQNTCRPSGESGLPARRA
jgi:hypothetical protein